MNRSHRQRGQAADAATPTSAASSAPAPTAAARRQDGMRALTRLLPYARPYAWYFAGVLLLVIVFNGTSVLQPFLVKIAIDSDISGPHPNVTGLVHITMFYAAIVVLGLGANYAQMLLLQFAGQSIVRHIRVDLFTHIERQAMSFFDQNAIGRLVTNVSSDTETVSQFFTQFFLSLARDGLSIVMIVLAMFELNARIGAEAMVIIPVIFAISLLFRRRLRNAYQTTRSRLSNVVSFLAENLAGMRIIQVFHQEPRQAAEFQGLNEGHRQANVHEYGVSVMFNRILELFGNVAVAGVVWVGGESVLHKAILFGTLYAFISYIQKFFQPINSITQQWNTLQSAMVAADRIGRVLTLTPAIQDAPVTAGQLPLTPAGRVEFREVTFGYQADRPVLHGVSLSVEAGQFVGFVGATGAGKSSIMSLLIRFYEPQSGRIEIDGIDIRQLPQRQLHQLVGLVQQEVNLFTGSVADNIRLFRPDISDAEVRAAAQVVGADRLIAKLQDGYDTHLYAKGANLSMGERQLLSFARVVCLNPRVLILDEATANLDSQTEEWVQRGLRAVAADRTTLVIAHRLSTVRYADRIYVLSHGRIVEQGSHADLLRAGGVYANLHQRSGVVERQVAVAARLTTAGKGVLTARESCYDRGHE